MALSFVMFGIDSVWYLKKNVEGRWSVKALMLKIKLFVRFSKIKILFIEIQFKIFQ